MGAICTKPNTNNVTNPAQFQNPASSMDIPQNEGFLEEILHINTKALIINSQEKEFAGEGIKKTYAYISHISEDEIRVKREEFWDTRTEGNWEAWQTIRAAVASDEKSAYAFLRASGLGIIKNSIQAVFDDMGNKYETPIFCINNPKDYELKRDSIYKFPDNFKKENIELKIRCAKLKNDLDLTIENSSKVATLKEIFQKMAKNEFSDIDNYNLRTFFRGKELKDEHYLVEFQLTNQDMIQIFFQAKKN